MSLTNAAAEFIESTDFHQLPAEAIRIARRCLLDGAAQMADGVDGQKFLLAFLIGFEVECKIAEWMRPDHYLKGMHTSGTVGTFGAYAAAAKLMNLTGNRLRHGFGIAASMAAGIRCNYGTMTKPLHVGRAAENGLTAALLAARGFTADEDALDGKWGFFSVHGNGLLSSKTERVFGEQWSIVSPGVAIKPYPCGVLTHPLMDLMRKMVIDNGKKSDKSSKIGTLRGGLHLKDPKIDFSKNCLNIGGVCPNIRRHDEDIFRL